MGSVVTGSHHNTHLVGHLREKADRLETAVPHGWPEVVCFQAQKAIQISLYALSYYHRNVCSQTKAIHH